MADVQSIIPIKDIKDGVVVLKGGGLRAVLLVSAVNFALKSQEEQNAIISQYQNFLNSLDFPLQIVASSRRLDISPYLAMLENKRREQPSELLRVQLSEYIDFVKSLIEVANVMNQTFYAVVPFSPIEKKGGILSGLGSIFSAESATQDRQSFEELKTQLFQRVDFVMAGLGQAGLKAVPLNKEELMEIYYHLFNPEAKERLHQTHS